MGQSDYIKKLLRGRSVEWKELGEVFDLRNGYTPRKSKEEYWTNGAIPWFRMEDIRQNGRILKDAIQKINKLGVKGKLFQENSFIISTSATIGEHALITVPYLSNQRFTNLALKNKYKAKLQTKFIFHYLFVLDEWCKKNSTISSFASVDMGKFRKFKIPIPPLDVQERIAEILDKFTELTKELTKELGLRKKQYAYYREKLLTFGDDVEWRELGEVGEFIRGSGLPKADFTESGVPAIHYGQIYTYYGVYTNKTISFVSEETAKKLKKVNNGDVVITNTSENFEDICKAVVYLGEKQAVTGGHASIFKPSEIVLSKYFAYFTQTDSFYKQKIKLAKGTKVIDVSAKDMMKIKIPLPPLAEQERIVKILDKFDTLTNSISEGLPREIELRQKQYEYYRDLLLTF